METMEIRDIVISALVLALAFGISNSGGFSAFSDITGLAYATLISLLIVSTGFILHELGHRFMANRYKCRAEFKIWPPGVLLALVFSLFGFVFAAPGAVVIYPRVSLWGRVENLGKKAYGIISATGPAINIMLSIAFLAAGTYYPLDIFTFGSFINAWLAAFNLIPILPLDGAKVFAWDKRVWLILGIICIVLLFA